VQPFKAIAAMSLNRVIGIGNKLPWHIPDDFKWFKKVTTGQIVVMGRKTFDSIGKPLPNRTTVVLTRSPQPIAGVQTISDLNQLRSLPLEPDRQIFICGGRQLYEQALPLCSDLYLTVVQRLVDGDTQFPPFEQEFELAAPIFTSAEFHILHYRNRVLRREPAEQHALVFP
jgi:dihydrofolate reductase